MKYLTLSFIVTVLLAGCSNSSTFPIKYMSDQSHLTLANYDSVEYYKADKNIWNFPARDPFIAILYFDDQHFQKNLRQIKKDTSYHVYKGKEEPEKAYSYYFKKYLSSPPPECSMNETMFRHDNYTSTGDVTIIFCNRIYFNHIIKGPLD